MILTSITRSRRKARFLAARIERIPEAANREYLTLGGLTVPVYSPAVSGQPFVAQPDCTVGASASQCAADLQRQLEDTRHELDEARAMGDWL